MMILSLGGVLFLLFFPKSHYFFGLIFGLDSSLLFLSLLFSLVLLLILFASFNFVSSYEKLLYLIIFMGVSAMLFFCFNSFFSMYFLLFLESCVTLMILCIIVLSKDLDKISSALFMFFINIFPSIFFMVFCACWPGSIEGIGFSLSLSFSMFMFMCFSGLLLSKLPIFFLHFWLTKAHVSASGCGSMILASLLLKIGTVGFYKFYFIFILDFFYIKSFFFCLVSLSLLFLVFVMIRFFDMKYLVACSSIVHMGPIFPSLMGGSGKGIFSSYLMKVGHGIVSFIIFYLVTLLYEMGHNRSLDYNKSFYSLSGSLYFFFVFFFIFNLGFPPFSSFISEVLFLSVFFDFSIFPFSFFLIAVLLSGVFFFFMISKTLYGKKSLFIVSYGGVSNFFLMIFYTFFFLVLPFIYF